MKIAEGRARLSLTISGRVQGVGFRATAYDEARSLGLAGWVRNMPSGEVEIVAEGKRENLEMLLAWAYSGPPGAHVVHLQEEWASPTGEFADFRIRS
jgi:acylphosphatase